MIGCRSCGHGSNFILAKRPEAPELTLPTHETTERLTNRGKELSNGYQSRKTLGIGTTREDGTR